MVYLYHIYYHAWDTPFWWGTLVIYTVKRKTQNVTQNWSVSTHPTRTRHKLLNTSRWLLCVEYRECQQLIREWSKTARTVWDPKQYVHKIKTTTVRGYGRKQTKADDTPRWLPVYSIWTSRDANGSSLPGWKHWHMRMWFVQDIKWRMGKVGVGGVGGERRMESGGTGEGRGGGGGG